MSALVDFGWWTTPRGPRLLAWDPDTGRLLLFPDPERMGAETLAVVADEIDLRRRIDGWADHCTTPEGLDWLAQRLEGCQ